MSGLFSTSSDFNQDISSWDVSNVTNMSGMFGVSETNTPNRMNITEVLASEALRVQNTLRQDIALGGESNIAGLFSRVIAETGERHFNKDISKWDVSKVTNMSGMFAAATKFNQDISRWDVSNVTDMTGMFFFATKFNQNISSWGVSKVTNMFGMFADATDFNRDVGKWEVSKVTNMSGMFMNATKFDRELGEWEVSKVTNMAGMFLNATKFNQDISKWGVFNVKNMAGMFFSATAFNQDISKWNVSKCTNMSGMLFNAITFNNGRPEGVDGGITLVVVDGDTGLFSKGFTNFNSTNINVTVYDEFATRTVMAAQYTGGNDKLVNDLFPPRGGTIAVPISFQRSFFSSAGTGVAGQLVPAQPAAALQAIMEK